MNSNSKGYYIYGGLLLVAAAGFAAYALGHPEASFPWPRTYTYILYGLYAAYTVLVFAMPKMKGCAPIPCALLGAQFLALGLIVLSVATRNNPNEANWYLPAGLVLTCAANFANLAYQRRLKLRNTDKDEETR